jgi:hypothetical protein
MAAGLVALAAMPVVYAAAALAAAATKSTTKFSNSLAADPFFIVGVAVVQVLVAALFTYAWFDLDGIQVCGSVVSPDADGFSYPSSKCMSRGILQDFFPALAPYELPQVFCKQARLYCECSNNELLPCNTVASGCGCASTQCCSANGLCASEELTDMPLTGRPLTTRVVEPDDNGTSSSSTPPIETTALCVAAALVIGPCVAILASALTHKLANSSPSLWWVPVLASAAAFLVALGACFVPLVLWYIDGTDVFLSTTTAAYEVGVGACSSLPAYPEQVVVTSLSSGPVFYQQKEDLDAQGLPQYAKVTTTTTNCSTCCAAYSSTSASASSTCTSLVCGTECLCQSLTTQLTASGSSTTACYSWPPSMLSFSVEAQAWTMYEPNNSLSPQLFNVKTSSVVYQEPTATSTGNSSSSSISSSTKPTMYTVFQDSDALAQNTLTICGFYQGQSSCTDCACSSLTTD